MKASTKRISSILGSALLIIVCLVILSYLIEPAYQEVKNRRAEVAARLKLVSDYEASLDRVQKLLNEYQNVIKFQQAISSILPTEQNLPQAVNQITNLASLNRLNVEVLSVERLAIRLSSEPTIAKGIGTLRISFRLTGDYEGFKSFLENLETNINIMDLQALRIEEAQQIKGGGNKFAYTMTVDTYYQSE